MHEAQTTELVLENVIGLRKADVIPIRSCEPWAALTVVVTNACYGAFVGGS
jgi:CO dehydrogenase/acetyl-CoA synthase gamma subunit (corrinoid Fe-S protein)